MPLTIRIAALVAVLVLAACDSENTVEVSRAVAPDGKVVAIYTRHFYGGAAGGTGHCVAIAGMDHSEDSGCIFLASHVSSLRLAWSGDVLYICYSQARITSFQNEAHISSRAITKSYEIRLIVLNERRNNCG